MAAARDDMSRVVYVGHVPFDLTEEQIEDIFKSAGPVQQTRLVFDRVTNKSKGFAFVQYFEPESAASAVRNLDNYKVGNMHLKVNYSSGRFPSNGPHNNNSQPGKKTSNADDDTGVVPEIVNIVSGIPPPQKLELLSELRVAIETNKSQVQKLLAQNPQLAYAIVQSMFELNKIDASSTSSLIVNDTPPTESRQVSAGSRSGTPSTNYASNAPSNRQPSRSIPQTSVPPQNYSQNAQQPIPPSGGMPANVPPSVQQQQAQIYQQIMTLTPDQINTMPPEQRNWVMQVRAQMQQPSHMI